MKKTFLFLLIACSLTAQAQITSYNNAAQNNFYGLGGYAFTQTTFPNGVQTNPYIITGSSPQNDFICVVSATGGITNVGSSISTSTIYTPITIQFKGNNVRKFGCRAFASIFGGGGTTADVVQLTATTNLGNTAIMNGSTASLFVGFRVTGTNEYLTSIEATFTSPVAATIALRNIIVGDDTPQNVALNLDGVNDYVALPSTVANFNYNEDYTISVWVKPNQIQNETTYQDNEILEKWDGVANSYPFVLRYFNQTAGANIGKVTWARYSPSSNVSINSSVTINDGRWHHIAVNSRLNVGNRIFSMYIDGVSQGSVIDNTTGTNTNSVPLYIGKRGNGINHFTGGIDELRIWNIGKDIATIQNEMFCKTPNPTNLQAAYNFNNGVPNGNNALITQVQDAVGSNHGTLNNFAQTGDASNWVTGQVKYVKKDASGSNNGSSWTNALTDLQSALTATPCNDLVEVYAATGTYKPATSDVNISYNIPSGMQIYGGFAGTEKNINERNIALIHTTNETKLSGDLGGNDTPFDFSANRDENSKTVVKITNANSNTVFDGFTISGAYHPFYSFSAGGLRIENSSPNIQNCNFIDNQSSFGAAAQNINSSAIFNYCNFLGNDGTSGSILDIKKTIATNDHTKLMNCIFSGNNDAGESVIFNHGNNVPSHPIFINCTIANNLGRAMRNYADGAGTTNPIFKNVIIYGNNAGIKDGTPDIQYSLVQGVTTGTGNLNGNTTNPNFVNPIAFTAPTDLGNYRLKWCSLAIGAGNNSGISPLDLDRNPRLYRINVDMGAYEYMGNTPTGANLIDITYTIDIPNYEGVGVQRITSAAKILAPAGTVNFTAPNSITLNPGFEAKGVGKYFKAQIGANSVCSN